MKIYKIEQNAVGGWDTYDSAIVIAETAEAAQNTHPDGGTLSHYENGQERKSHGGDCWTASANDVTVTELGVANEDQEAGVICSSFNAG